MSQTKSDSEKFMPLEYFYLSQSCKKAFSNLKTYSKYWLNDRYKMKKIKCNGKKFAHRFNFSFLVKIF